MPAKTTLCANCILKKIISGLCSFLLDLYKNSRNPRPFPTSECVNPLHSNLIIKEAAANLYNSIYTLYVGHHPQYKSSHS